MSPIKIASMQVEVATQIVIIRVRTIISNLILQSNSLIIMSRMHAIPSM